ncbi:MAG TPA: hypothetical protein VL485_29310 [Ktedonobacteraceae bacterium]|nr:hypothetical protein [Ktedonobacteraceae bacterium]
MNHPVSLLWLEGMDPQWVTTLPALSFFPLQGCDLQLEPVPLVEREQCRYQVLTGMGPGQFGRFDNVRVEDYHIRQNYGVPIGAVDRLLPDSIRQQGLRVLSLELRTPSEVSSLALQAYDFVLIRVPAANDLSASDLNALVQCWLDCLPATAQRLVLTDVFSSPATMAVNVNDFLASAGLLKCDEHMAISWPETLAYGAGSGQLWLNVRGREPQGTIRMGREFRKVSEMLARELVLHWRNPLTDEPVVEKVLTKEEAYSGEYVFKAPDLTILYRPGYAPSANARALRLDGMCVLPVASAALELPGQPAYARLLASGSEIQQGQFAQASLLDICPSVLHLLGLALPARLDGQVVRSLFSEAYLTRHPVAYDPREDEPVSHEDERLILARLRELGYLA